jgi:hypothetical protein
MDTYLHIRVLFSMILGLGMSRLLGGVARIVQHPREYMVYWGPSGLGIISFSLPDSLLVVGISSRQHPRLDLPALFLHRPLRRSSFPSLRALFP